MKAAESPTTNACKLCAPLGACIAFKGIEGAIPFLHGSQGCSTYIRRYAISHFNEPLDVASSSFGESAAIFGGADNLKAGLANVIERYRPGLIGLATTCLAETIGDDAAAISTEFLRDCMAAGRGSGDLPHIVTVSTPSYRGTHMDGFHEAVLGAVKALAKGHPGDSHVNVLPGFVSPADLRHLKGILEAFGLDYVMLPDYSDTLDSPTWDGYKPLPPGGTPLADVRRMGRARATLQFGGTLGLCPGAGAGHYLKEAFGVPCHRLGMPIGIRGTDAFLKILGDLTGRPVPAGLKAERGRLLDSYVDGHKYVSRKRAVVYGEEDFVAGIASFLAEIGVKPVLCASGGNSGRLAEALGQACGDLIDGALVRQDADFAEIEGDARDLKPDIIVGSSKGYGIARRLGVPLVRVGFPIHDRLGGQRILHVGYRGAQQLFDLIVNSLISKKQDDSPVGYGYM